MHEFCSLPLAQNLFGGDREKHNYTMYTIILITMVEICTCCYGSPEKMDQTQSVGGSVGELPGVNSTYA